MLFFSQQNGGSSEEVCFLDWQVARIGTPVIDLSYFIFCCTDSTVRQRLPELLQMYHSTLIKRINELGSDGIALFPFSKLEEHMKRYSRFGFGMALLTLHTTTCSSNEMPDVIKGLETLDFSNMDDWSPQLIEKPAYKKRMSGVCRDMARFGYL